MKQKGFTLIELMVVVVILGILAGIAVPKMFGLSDKSKVSEAPQVLKTYETLQQAYIAEQSQIGNFDSITFVKPTASQYFIYKDLAPTGDEAKGGAQAGSRVKIGDCGALSIWATCVPNSTSDVERIVKQASGDDKACTKLSPATYQKDAEAFQSTSCTGLALLAAGE